MCVAWAVLSRTQERSAGAVVAGVGRGCRSPLPCVLGRLPHGGIGNGRQHDQNADRGKAPRLTTPMAQSETEDLTVGMAERGGLRRGHGVYKRDELNLQGYASAPNWMATGAANADVEEHTTNTC